MKKTSSKKVGKVFAEVTLGLLLVAFVACLCLYIFDAGFKTSVNNLLGVKTKTQLATVQAVNATKQNYTDIYDKINDLENFDNSTIEIVADIKSDLNDFAYIMDENKKFTVEELEVINSKLEAIQDKLDVLVQSMSSENFLINSEFTVNQRGSTTYSGTGSQVYTVDRWFTEYSGSSITQTDSGIVISSTGDNICTLGQIIENSLDDYQMCFSIKLEDGTIHYVTVTIEDDCFEQKRFDGGYIEIAKQLCNDDQQHIVVRIVCNPGETLAIKYAKLEIGSRPTPFTPNLVVKELELCQRYYLKISNRIVDGHINAGGTLYIELVCPTELFNINSVSNTYAEYIFYSETYKSISSLKDYTIKKAETNGVLRINYYNFKSSASISGPIICRLLGFNANVDCEIYLT